MLKAAIGDVAACRIGIGELEVAHELVKHEAAVLGAVTHAANNHEVLITGRDGKQHKQLLRDSAALRRRPPARGTSAPPARAPDPTTLVVVDPSADSHVARPRPPQHGRRAAAGRAAARQRSVEASRQVDRIVAAQAQAQRPASGPPAQERLTALRDRVRRRCAAAGHAA